MAVAFATPLPTLLLVFARACTTKQQEGRTRVDWLWMARVHDRALSQQLGSTYQSSCCLISLWMRFRPPPPLPLRRRRYCQMATWNASASCNQPEDSFSIATTATSAGGRNSFVVRGGAAGRGGGGASVRGRRVGSRARATPEAGEAAACGEARSWRRDSESRIGMERRESDAGSRGGAGGSGSNGGAGRSRGRSKKEDVLWVQCDKCLRWRKLALGMRLEDLPDKWCVLVLRF